MERWIVPNKNRKYKNYQNYKLKEIKTFDDVRVGMFVFYKGQKFEVTNKTPVISMIAHGQTIPNDYNISLYYNYYNCPCMSASCLIGEFEILN